MFTEVLVKVLVLPEVGLETRNAKINARCVWTRNRIELEELVFG